MVILLGDTLVDRGVKFLSTWPRTFHDSSGDRGGKISVMCFNSVIANSVEYSEPLRMVPLESVAIIDEDTVPNVYTQYWDDDGESGSSSADADSTISLDKFFLEILDQFSAPLPY